MIKGICVSNRDKFSRCEWPTLFVAVPQRGEFVQAIGNNALLGKVSYVTHKMRRIKHDQPLEEPIIEIYLEDPSLL